LERLPKGGDRPLGDGGEDGEFRERIHATADDAQDFPCRIGERNSSG
jgi:hypothetical protein